jgi:hypothetical protein
LKAYGTQPKALLLWGCIGQAWRAAEEITKAKRATADGQKDIRVPNKQQE